MRPGKGYSYIGALYNIVVCAGVGIIVSLLTEAPKEKYRGTYNFDAAKLKANFKGGKVNEALGRKFWLIGRFLI